APARGAMGVKDLVDRSAEFNGLSMDGWASPDTRLVLPIAAGVTRAHLRLEGPGWANYQFPLRVTVEANGGKHGFALDRAGSHDLAWTVAPDATSLALHFESSQSTVVPGTGTASFRIESLAVE